MSTQKTKPTPENPNPEIRMWKNNSEVTVVSTQKTYNLAVDFALNDFFEEVGPTNPLEIHEVIGRLKNDAVKHMLGKVDTDDMKEYHTILCGAERFFKELFESEVKHG